MKIVLTGGHLAPALALLPKLLQKHTVAVIGRKYTFEGDNALSFEYQTLIEMGVYFKTITAGRLQRRFTRHTIPALFKFPIGFFQSFFILRKFHPDVVLSFGGYVALPVAISAFLLHIPIITHEQTITAGLANRIIGIFAKKICLTFEQSQQYFPKGKTLVTGNPLRRELFTPPQKSPFAFAKRDLPIIYITGGSGGSHAINLLIADILDVLLANTLVIHQVGNSWIYNDFAMLSKKAETLPVALKKRYVFKKHVNAYELSWIYHNTDLLIGRSGANTVYEVLTFGIPALFVPLPWAGSSEQEANAELVEKVGLGKILLQEDLSSSLLFTTIVEMLQENSLYKSHATKAAVYVEKHAAENIIGVLEGINKQG